MAPTPEEMGHCDSVYLSELGDTQVVVFKHGMCLETKFVLQFCLETPLYYILFMDVKF